MSANGQRATFGIEQSYDTADGDSTFQLMSSEFIENPDMVIIQNDSNVDVILSQYGIDKNVTFVSGTKLVLDMTDKNPINTFFTFSKGENWFASSDAGTGIFRIAYLYRKQ